MFGHDNDKPHEDQDKPADDTVQPDDNASSDWQHPGTPLDSGSDDQTPQTPADTSDDATSDSDSPQTATTAPPAQDPAPPEPSAPEPTSNTSAGSSSADDLIDLKQEALTKLSPLVDHLDQAPDDKFRTLMMMIQASDDQALVKDAYDTALKIDDEKERAQALLDIVNEINYFTQSPNPKE